MRNSPQITVSYLVLCHDSPERIIRLVMKILSEDETGHVLIHFDKNSPESAYEELCVSLKDTTRCTVLANRVKCGWGQWSLVEASLRMLEDAFSNYKDDYYYLLSEYCYPVKPLSELKSFLAKNKGLSFIECEPSSWIKGGIREDRYLYRHFFNKKKSPLLHRWSYRLQKRIYFKKKWPKDIEVMFGSQWWCISHDHIAESHLLNNSDMNEFKLCWVPDECAIQTIIFKNIRRDKIVSQSLTYNDFDAQGIAMSVSLDYEFSDNVFFSRKNFV
ncbi:hypothetical protein E0X81_11905 [Halomonas sp. GDM18]|nr:hypothetical protein E0X81_11905 [Halomonas sp. GDM18]